MNTRELGRRETKARGGHWEGERKGASHRPPRAPDFSICPFFLSFPSFLAVSPLKEPLRRRESETRSAPREN